MRCRECKVEVSGTVPDRHPTRAMYVKGFYGKEWECYTCWHKEKYGDMELCTVIPFVPLQRIYTGGRVNTLKGVQGKRQR